MRFRRRRDGLAVLAALALVARPLAADLVVLRNGQELRGRVRARGDQIRIELDVGGTVTVAKGDVARMEVDEAARAAGAEEAAVSAELLQRLEAREQIHARIADLASDNEDERVAAEQKLVAIGRAALPMLRRALAEGSTARRGRALQALAAIGDRASLPAIRAILAQPKDQALHPLAAKALADVAGHAAVPALTALLVTSKHDAVRLACLKELAARRAPFAAPFVVDAARSPALRATALRAISVWGDPVALPYALPLLDSPSSATCERAAGWTADLITPAHAATFTHLLRGYDDDKAMREALRRGVRRLHTEFPVVGDIELLGAPQVAVRTAAFESLKRQFSKAVTDRNEGQAKQGRFWRTQRGNATQARIVLVPVGSMSVPVVRELGKELERSLQALKIPVDVDRKPMPAAGGDGRRLLSALAARQLADPQAARVVGVTAEGVRMPGYDRALAPAVPGGPVVVSLAGLGEERTAVVRRARRLALHALARSFALPAPKDATCPASAVYEPSDLEAKAPSYCAATQDALIPSWDAERAAAAFDGQGAGRTLSRLGRQRKSRSLRMAAAYMFERALDLKAATAEWEAVAQMEGEQEVAAVVAARLKRLARAEKWLAAKTATARAPRNPRPRPGGG